MIVIGIDPGYSGGIARLQIGGGITAKPAAWKMGATERDIRDLIYRASRIVREVGAGSDTHAVAWIEKVHAMPKQGVSSTFKFGKNYGILLGVLTCLDIRTHEVSPGTWQRSLGCLTRGDKNVTKRKAQQLFPEIKVTHAIADALLIAEYGRGQTSPWDR